MLGFEGLNRGNLSLPKALELAIEEHRFWVRLNSERLNLQYGIRYFLVSSTELPGQLKELNDTLHLKDFIAPLSLCLKCNVRITELPVDQAENRVPEGIFKIHREFYECPRCRRVYWQGSHWKRMQQRLADWGF